MPRTGRSKDVYIMKYIEILRIACASGSIAGEL